MYIFLLGNFKSTKTSKIISAFINSSTTGRNMAMLCIVYLTEES